MATPCFSAGSVVSGLEAEIDCPAKAVADKAKKAAAIPNLDMRGNCSAKVSLMRSMLGISMQGGL